VEYLGNVIQKEGVVVEASKIEVMVQWPLPPTVRQLRGFLGLVGYYRRFVKGYGVVAQPLNEMLKKDNFAWTLEAKLAFQKLKELLSNTPVLALQISPKPLWLRWMHRGVALELFLCKTIILLHISVGA